MDGVLLVPVRAGDPADWQEAMPQLRQDVAQLRQEVSRVRRENLELRQQVGYWKAQHARAVQRLRHVEAEVEGLHGENRQLQNQLFGRKSEKSSSADRTNSLDGEEEESSPPRPRGQQPDRPGPGRRDYRHLPVQEDIRELPAAQRICPQCGQALTPSDTEDSEQIEIEVRAYRRRIRRRRYQRSGACTGCPRTVTAPPLPKLIPKGRLGVSVWVEILLDKFFSHRPTERLLGQWRLLGLDLAPGTVTDGLQRLEPLFTPVYQALLQGCSFIQAEGGREGPGLGRSNSQASGWRRRDRVRPLGLGG
jgi:transposase